MRRSRGGLKCSGSRAVRGSLERDHHGDQVPWQTVRFQRFFRKGPGSAGFRVKQRLSQHLVAEARADEQVVQDVGLYDTGTDEVFRRLAMLEKEQAQAGLGLSIS